MAKEAYAEQRRSASAARIEELFPELSEMKKSELRESVVTAWLLALKKGGWKLEQLEEVPWTLLIPTAGSLVAHTRRVVRMAMAVAREKGHLDLDLIIAGSLLHDVGKLLEYELKDGRAVKSSYGKLVRHPISGYALALEAGLPLEVAHIIMAHSKEGESVEKTPEAILVHHCDFIDFEIAKANKKKEAG